MRPNAGSVMTHIGDTEEEITMGIAQEAMAHIMTVLTDLYSDQKLAVIREYSTNGWDSHVDAGVTRPIEVSLPDITRPKFEVQDYGLGLNIDEIRNIYANYGSSTKRNSDAVNGMLGLGCKSALTYANQFSVEAVKDGQRVLALITKNEQGIGAIKVLEKSSTHKPNGVKVSIPVNAGDVAAFRDKAREFYSYWEPGTVLVNGEEPALERHIDGPDHMWIDPDVRVTKNQGHGRIWSTIIMGNVPYKYAFENLRVQVTAWVPIGSVSFPPSRESLMMNDRTTDALKTIEEFVEERFAHTLQSKLATATNWERLRAWDNWGYGSARNIANPNSLRGAKSALATALQVPGVSPSRYNGIEVRLPEGRPVFGYNFSYDGSHKTEDAIQYTSIGRNSDSIPVIIGYPFKSVTNTTRRRIKEYTDARHRGVNNCWFLPDGMRLEWLEGRPNVIDWQSVLDNTTAPPKEAAKRTKTEVVYTYFVDGKEYHNSGKFPDDDKSMPLLITPLANLPLKPPTKTRWGYTTTTIGTVSKQHPEARFVSLAEGQIAKFQRLHPYAEHYKKYTVRAADEAVKALSAKDKDSKLIATVIGATDLATLLAQTNTPVRDPDLIHLASLHGHDSDALRRCARQGLEVPLGDRVFLDRIWNRYPLLPLMFGRMSYQHQRDEVMFYIGARWDADQATQNNAQAA